MENVIIIAVFAVIVLVAVRSTVKHFRGQGGCCGGGTYKAKKKKLQGVIVKKTIIIQGMNCQHCVNRVMEALNDIPGVSAVVHLNRGEAVVSMDRVISDQQLKSVVEKAGYTVTGIR